MTSLEGFDRVSRQVAKNSDVSPQRATALVKDVFEQLRKVVADDDVTVPGFGTFRLVDQDERDYTNPQTGDPVKVPHRQKLVFEPAVELERELKALESS